MATANLNPKPPAHSDHLKVALPEDHILLLTFNRPHSLNAMTSQMERDLNDVLNWFDSEPSLWVVIVTGAGRAFCAGADLKSWNKDQQGGKIDEQERIAANVHGFGSISRRETSSKPIIAAVNGGAYGGGMEIVLNCDLVIASQDARFSLPEVKRGVVAIQGGIPRLARLAGHQLASELLLLGKTIAAAEAQNRFGFVNMVVKPSEVLPTAIRVAREIIQNSPDAIQCTKKGLLLAQRLGFRDTVLTHAWASESKRLYTGENIKEGLKAFTEKRTPVWKNPAKL